MARCGVKISAQLGWFLAETNPALDTCSRAGVNRRFPLAVCRFDSQLAVVTFTAPELAMGLFSVKNRRINKHILLKQTRNVNRDPEKQFSCFFCLKAHKLCRRLALKIKETFRH